MAAGVTSQAHDIDWIVEIVEAGAPASDRRTNYGKHGIRRLQTLIYSVLLLPWTDERLRDCSGRT